MPAPRPPPELAASPAPEPIERFAKRGRRQKVPKLQVVVWGKRVFIFVPELQTFVECEAYHL